MKNKFLKLVVVIFPAFALSSCGSIVDPEPIKYENFGVGNGLKDWDKNSIVPFIDFADYWGYNEEYGKGGAPKMVELGKTVSTNLFNIGFIQAIPPTKEIPNPTKDKEILWGWAGLSVLSEGSEHEQYLAMKSEILRFRENGGDVAISIGGLTGTSFWMLSGITEDMLCDIYMKIIIGFGLTHFDLDIEGSAMSAAQNKVNASAIKKVQDKTKVKINLTLPVNWDGLDSSGKSIIDIYLKQNVLINNINLMTMCYTNVPAEKDFGDLSIDAVNTASDQIMKIFGENGIDISFENSYGMIGTIPSIGFESDSFPIYTTEMHQKVIAHAKQKGLASVSMWCLDRDAKCGSYKTNTGVSTPFEFSEIAKSFKN